MIDEDHDALDGLLRRSLQARPEPALRPDLAARARRLAAVEAPAFAGRLHAVRRAQAVLAGLGHVLVVGVAVIACLFLRSALGAASSTETVWSAASTDGSSSELGWILGVTCALGAVVALGIQAAFSSDLEATPPVGARPLTR